MPPEEYIVDSFKKQQDAGSDFQPATDPAYESAAKVEEPNEDEHHSCTIIGPANSGKTTLLLAMQQACLQEPDDDFKLDFMPESETAAGLISLAGEFLFHGNTVRASRQVTNYSFRVYVNNMRTEKSECYCKLNVTDGPGGYLFPSERGSSNIGTSSWTDLVETTRRSRSLVLCVDGSAPALETLYHGLPKLIFDLKRGHRRLPFRRVLLLVTKIDRIIEKFHQHARSYQQYASVPIGGVNPALKPMCLPAGSSINAAGIARMLHPMGQARQLFGRLLDMVQAGLDPAAKFVVGLCSALGFHAESGSAFVDSIPEPIGRPESLAARFRDWEPFGVREAILFLVADEIRHPLEEVPKTIAAPSSKSWNVRIPLHV